MIWSGWRRRRRVTVSPSPIVFTRRGSTRTGWIRLAPLALSTHGYTTLDTTGKSFRVWPHLLMRRDTRRTLLTLRPRKHQARGLVTVISLLTLFLGACIAVDPWLARDRR